MATLVIVPCGRSKIWDKNPAAGPTKAMDAYTGSPFKVNRAYAEIAGERWVILSAKYGYIAPDSTLAGPYNVTFKRKSTGPVDILSLQRQIEELGLQRFDRIIGLGGVEYRRAIEASFEPFGVRTQFPFAGLPVGRAMQVIKNALATDGNPDKRRPERIREVGIASVEEFGDTEISQRCEKLHRWFNQLPLMTLPLSTDQVPRNGLYILFENGEQAHGGRRIVRVGTHTGQNQLRGRLKDHFVKENKDRSIFRKNIGRCLLHQSGDPFLTHWEIDTTTREAREKYRHIDGNSRLGVEREVTNYMQKSFSLAVFEVPDKTRRMELESKIIATISRCKDCRPSSGWLGLQSPVAKIRESGLWLVNELYRTPLTEAETERLGQSLKVVDK